MSLSVFDLFKIGIGPSSSHTVGPMVAARRFLDHIDATQNLEAIHRLTIDLFGSLAMTGIGHGTDTAILLGLQGEIPSVVDTTRVAHYLQVIRERRELNLLGRHNIVFDETKDLIYNKGASLSLHSNGITFNLWDEQGNNLARENYYSVGGGFVMSEEELQRDQMLPESEENPPVPFPFESANELLAIGERTGKSISDIVMANELAMRSEPEVIEGVWQIWKVMEACIARGCQTEGILPGGLKVKRRAPNLFQNLTASAESGNPDALAVMDWVSLYALAVNEENAAGSRVVTAPTNGAAGVIPAVLAYYCNYVHSPEMGGLKQAVVKFMLTASVIGQLFKLNASISAAEVGCQGEIGVACSMAAAGLSAVLGGSNRQIENAAEIGMEHNLGLTCDPIGGLVQIPCIERNTMGAIKAINASRLALRGTGEQFVPLDSVIETMRQTGRDMQDKYKETSSGGLAVNVVEC